MVSEVIRTFGAEHGDTWRRAASLAGERVRLAKYRPRLSLAAYHGPSDLEKIPLLVRQGWTGNHAGVRPDVLYFW